MTGNVTAMRENGATSGAGVLATFAYDSLGRRTAASYGNGTSSSYGYDAVSRLTSLGHDLASTSADFSATLSYGPASQIATRTSANDTYAFNGYANAASSYTADGLNRYSSAAGVTPSYDARGNLTGLGSASYSYDTANRLTSGGGKWLYYEPLGRLTWLADPSWANPLLFVYDGNHMIAEQDSVIERRYVYVPGEDTPLVWYEGSGTSDRRWLHADERGSVIAVSDGSGAALTINAYDEYGNETASAPTYRGRFGYTGQQWIAGLGLWYYKNRMYSPALGRFLQTDPIGVAGGINLYAYVGNDPINLVDPLGLARAPTGCPFKGSVQNEVVVCGAPEDPMPQADFDRLIGSISGANPSVGEWTFLGPLGSLAPPSNQCTSPKISPAEAAAAAKGDRKAFWDSRAARGDPLGSTGQAIVNDASGLGWTANAILEGAIANRSPNMGIRAIQAEVNQIGVEIMRAHLNAVNTFGSPSAGQIAAYHFQIFNAHDLPNSTFGGSVITGTETEAWATSKIWMNCR